MNKEEMKQWALSIAEQEGFIHPELIYQGNYYQQDHIRNMIFSGSYQNQPAVLKVYNDPRYSLEPSSLKAFHKHNISKLLTAPALLAYKEETKNKGWLILEHLPEGIFFSSPLSSNERQEFIHIYKEYRHSFPKEPTRPLFPSEETSVIEWTKNRFSRWHELCVKREDERKEPLYDKTMLNALVENALEFIEEHQGNESFYWSHGHIKPQEVFKPISGSPIYLIDFAHSQMLPFGYELAFIIWADWMMTASWDLPYEQWKEGIIEWVHHMETTLENPKKIHSILFPALLERTIGTILADIGASDKPFEELQKGAKLHIQLAQDLLNQSLF